MVRKPFKRYSIDVNVGFHTRVSTQESLGLSLRVIELIKTGS